MAFRAAVQIHREEGWEEGRGGGGESLRSHNCGKGGERLGGRTTRLGDKGWERDELHLALRPGWLVWGILLCGGQGHRGRGRPHNVSGQLGASGLRVLQEDLAVLAVPEGRGGGWGRQQAGERLLALGWASLWALAQTMLQPLGPLPGLRRFTQPRALWPASASQRRHQ